MDKKKILQKLCRMIEEDLRRQLAANASASEGATHSEAKAETKWDTCGLEQSYLARGHAKQFDNLLRQLEELRVFVPAGFNSQPVAPGALVKIRLDREEDWFFLLPCAGGTDVGFDGQTITVITPESPLGQALANKRRGDRFSFRANRQGMVLEVV